MPEPVSVTVGVPGLIIAGLALLGINAAGWRLFGAAKIKQYDEYDERIRKLEENHQYIILTGEELNKKMDLMHEIIEKLRDEILNIYKDKQH